MKVIVWCRIEKKFFVVKNLSTKYNASVIFGLVLPVGELINLDRAECTLLDVPPELRGKLQKSGCVIGKEVTRGQ